MNKASNAVVAKPKVTGGIWVAPIGTPLPTNELTALNAAFKSPGYATEDGVTRTESRDTTPIKAWGGDTIVIAQTGVEATLQVGFAEYLNALTQALIYGAGNVTETPATSSTGRKLVIVGKLSLPAPRNSWAVEMFSGTATGRLVLPDVQVTETDDVSYKDDELAARSVTATLFPDSTGAYFYEYWDDGVLSA